MRYIINELTCANCQTRLSDLYISLGHPEEKVVYRWKCPVCGAENERVAFPFDTLLQGNIPHWEHGGATPTPFKLRSVAEETQACARYFNMAGAEKDAQIEEQGKEMVRRDTVIKELTARAESAERERDAAIKDIEELMKLTVYSTVSCKFCKKKHTGCRDGCVKPKWRGLQPQEGEKT